MKSLITEEEKLRIRSMHINEKYSLLKEEGGFDDLLPIDLTTASTVKTATDVTTATADTPKSGTPEAKAFQDWLDVNKVNWNPSNPKLNWIKLNKKGKGYGTFGPRTKAAYEKFKDEYNKSKTQ
jgi:hypothetical protein